MGSERAKKMICYKNRKSNMLKKGRELSTLCDLKLCVIVLSPDGKLETWPENLYDVKTVSDAVKQPGRKRTYVVASHETWPQNPNGVNTVLDAVKQPSGKPSTSVTSHENRPVNFNGVKTVLDAVTSNETGPENYFNDLNTVLDAVKEPNRKPSVTSHETCPENLNDVNTVLDAVKEPGRKRKEPSNETWPENFNGIDTVIDAVNEPGGKRKKPSTPVTTHETCGDNLNGVKTVVDAVTSHFQEQIGVVNEEESRIRACDFNLKDDEEEIMELESLFSVYDEPMPCSVYDCDFDSVIKMEPITQQEDEEFDFPPSLLAQSLSSFDGFADFDEFYNFE